MTKEHIATALPNYPSSINTTSITIIYQYNQKLLNLVTVYNT